MCSKRTNIDYYEYIQSPEWRARADVAKQRAGYRCQVCNRSASEITLDAHHRTYERLGHEQPEDITVLCRDCHELYETQKRLVKPPRPLSETPSRNSPPTYIPPNDSITTPDLLYGHSATLPSTVSTSSAVQSKPGSTLSRGTATDIPAAATQTYISTMPKWEEEPASADDVEVDTVSDDDLPRHMLVWLGRTVHLFGYAGGGFLFLAMQWALIIENPINLINPFAYLMALANTLAIPLFWQFTVFSVVGAGLTIGSAWLVQAIRPRKSVIRWYWQWRPSLLITVPIFLFCWFNGLYATAGLVNTGLRIVAGYVEPSMFLIGANLLRVYIALLPLPVLHLIWDNRFRHTWAKLLISLVAIPVFLLIISVFEYWRMGVMCDAGLVEDSTCSFYFYPSNPLPDPASNDLKAADSLGVTLPSPTPTIQPTSTPNMEPTPASAFVPGAPTILTVCYEHEFDNLTEKCRQHHEVFTGKVERLYVSWTPSKNHEGALFLRKWYFDGEHFLDSESTNEYAYLEVATRDSLKPGNYKVELYVSGQLVAVDSFSIR